MLMRYHDIIKLCHLTTRQPVILTYNRNFSGNCLFMILLFLPRPLCFNFIVSWFMTCLWTELRHFNLHNDVTLTFNHYSEPMKTSLYSHDISLIRCLRTTILIDFKDHKKAERLQRAILWCANRSGQVFHVID